jgi:hypothetical protein
MSTRTDKYNYAYVNSIASDIKRSKGDVSGSLQRLVDAGYARKIAFPEVLKSRGRRPREVFIPERKLNAHFDFGSSPSGATSATHMLLLLSAADFLGKSCGAFVGAWHDPSYRKANTQQETDKRYPDGYALFRKDEFAWDVTRPFSLEGETPTSLSNNRSTRQVSLNARKNFLLGFRGNIFACFSFDTDRIRAVVGELPAELARRTFCLEIDCDTDVVRWAVELPLRRKAIDVETLGCL